MSCGSFSKSNPTDMILGKPLDEGLPNSYTGVFAPMSISYLLLQLHYCILEATLAGETSDFCGNCPANIVFYLLNFLDNIILMISMYQCGHQELLYVDKNKSMGR